MISLITNSALTLCLPLILGCSNQMTSMKGVSDDLTADDTISVKETRTPPAVQPPSNNPSPPASADSYEYYRAEMGLIVNTKPKGALRDVDPTNANHDVFVDIRIPKGKWHPCELEDIHLCLKDKTRPAIYKANPTTMRRSDAYTQLPSSISYDIVPKADNTHKDRCMMISCVPTQQISHSRQKLSINLDHTPQSGEHEMYIHNSIIFAWVSEESIHIQFEHDIIDYNPADSCFN